MGLGSKIKEALHGDHHDKTTTEARPPGAFPQDDIPQRHADGKDYIAPHGSLIDKNRNTGTTGTTGTTGSDSLGHSNTQRNKLHKEGEGYLPSDADHATSTHDARGHKPVDSGIGLGASGRDRTSEGAYWGDLSPSGHASKGNHGLSEDPTGRGHGEYSPIGTAHNVSSLPDRNTHGHGLGHDQTAGGTSHHSPLHGDRPVGGGVYNTVAGAGSPDHDRSHGSAKPHVSGGAVHDPLTSGTTGASVPSGRNEYDYKTSLTGTGERGLGQGALSQGGLSGGGLGGSGLGGNGLSGSSVGRSQGYGDNGLAHHEHSTGHGNSHAGAGLAGAGVAAAAGYGANEFAHRGQGNTGHGAPYDSPSSHHAPGVPRSSMLDVEPSGGVTGSHHGHQAAGIPHNTSLGSERNVTPPHHGSHGIGGGSPTNVGSGTGTHMGQSSPATSGHGNSHYGPGHSGAKVMHQCQHCGRDNDISQYFKQDVVYRLGQ